MEGLLCGVLRCCSGKDISQDPSLSVNWRIWGVRTREMLSQYAGSDHVPPRGHRCDVTARPRTVCTASWECAGRTGGRPAKLTERISTPSSTSESGSTQIDGRRECEDVEWTATSGKCRVGATEEVELRNCGRFAGELEQPISARV